MGTTESDYKGYGIVLFCIGKAPTSLQDSGVRGTHIYILGIVCVYRTAHVTYCGLSLQLPRVFSAHLKYAFPATHIHTLKVSAVYTQVGIYILHR